jgi:hypothetical protein
VKVQENDEADGDPGVKDEIDASANSDEFHQSRAVSRNPDKINARRSQDLVRVFSPDDTLERHKSRRQERGEDKLRAFHGPGPHHDGHRSAREQLRHAGNGEVATHRRHSDGGRARHDTMAPRAALRLPGVVDRRRSRFDDDRRLDHRRATTTAVSKLRVINAIQSGSLK